MAVAYSSTKSASPATAASFTSASWTISGTNPVIVVYVALNAATQTVSSVSWSLGSGTPVEVKNIRNGSTFLSVWAIPAPTTGSGTYSVSISGSGASYQISADLFTGADQTTPCPTADATASSNNAVTSITLTPSNLTSSDGNAGIGANTTSGDVSSFSPNQTFLNDTTGVNAEAGYSLGTGSITANWTGVTGAVQAMVAVRIAAAGGAAPAAPLRRMGLMGAGL